MYGLAHQIMKRYSQFGLFPVHKCVADMNLAGFDDDGFANAPCQRVGRGVPWSTTHHFPSYCGGPPPSPPPGSVLREARVPGPPPVTPKMTQLPPF